MLITVPRTGRSGPTHNGAAAAPHESALNRRLAGDLSGGAETRMRQCAGCPHVTTHVTVTTLIHGVGESVTRHTVRVDVRIYSMVSSLFGSRDTRHAGARRAPRASGPFRINRFPSVCAVLAPRQILLVRPSKALRTFGASACGRAKAETHTLRPRSVYDAQTHTMISSTRPGSSHTPTRSPFFACHFEVGDGKCAPSHAASPISSPRSTTALPPGAGTASRSAQLSPPCSMRRSSSK